MPMKYVTNIEDKVELIQKSFSDLIGSEISGYEIAQMWCEEEQEWSDWMDLPLYLTIDEKVLSISWTKFDDLAIDLGRFIPFSLGGTSVRWLCEDVEMLDSILGNKVVSISLGRGDMTIEEKDVEIWTRLLITLSNGSTFEIYNALDENAFKLHSIEIDGVVRKCI